MYIIRLCTATVYRFINISCDYETYKQLDGTYVQMRHINSWTGHMYRRDI